MIGIAILKTDGSTERIYCEPENVLKTLQGAVGGYIEIVTGICPPDYLCIVNEDGLRLQLEPNPYAPHIVGDIALIKAEHME